jgi:hypothetical protein
MVDHHIDASRIGCVDAAGAMEKSVQARLPHPGSVGWEVMRDGESAGNPGDVHHLLPSPGSPADLLPAEHNKSAGPPGALGISASPRETPSSSFADACASDHCASHAAASPPPHVPFTPSWASPASSGIGGCETSLDLHPQIGMILFRNSHKMTISINNMHYESTDRTLL